MPRPKTIANAGLLDAALEIMNDQGPAALTFSSLARAAGLAPATLVQRFRSKEGLLESALLHAWDQLEARTASADATAPVTPAGAVNILIELSQFGDGDRFADALLILREDYRNPKMRERGQRWGRDLALALGRRLTAEQPAQLRLGRLLANQWQGALIWWGFSREGTVTEFVRTELQAFLDAGPLDG